MKKNRYRLGTIFLSIFIFLVVSSVSAKTYEFKFAHNYPPPTALGRLFTNWAKKVNADSQGRIKVTVYGAGALIKPAEFYDAIVGGVVDMAYGQYNQDMSRFSLDTGLCLAGLEWPEKWPNVDVRMKVYDELRQKFPIMGEKQKDVVILFDVVMAPFVFHSPKKAVRTPDDLKGMKVAATGWYVTMAKKLGAVPVGLPGPARYMALERNTIDGSWDLYAGMWAMKIIEVTNNYVEADFGDSSGIAIMSREKFEALPPDLQKILLDNKEYAQNDWLRMCNKETEMGIKEIQRRKQKIITLTSDEKEQWRTALTGLREDWIQSQEDLGMPGRAFMEEMLRLIEKYR